MSIQKPFSFVANTYAKSNEVNANFDVAYSQINTNISNIAKNGSDITNLENNKANINGSASEVFSVKDPESSSHAVNKNYLIKAIGNSVDYISGLIITKDSGSPEDTIIVSEGSCYDSTKSVVLSLANSLSKQNDNQGANATYYVYIIGTATGSLTDILISTSSTAPTLPSGYTLYRQIGHYTTGSDSKISSIAYYGESVESDKSINYLFNALTPDYTHGISVTLPVGSSNKYTALYNGIYAIGLQVIQGYRKVYVNNAEVAWFASGGDGSSVSTSFVPMKKGDTVYIDSAPYQTRLSKFFPYIGEGV